MKNIYSSDYYCIACIKKKRKKEKRDGWSGIRFCFLTLDWNLQCDAMHWKALQCTARHCKALQCRAVCALGGGKQSHTKNGINVVCAVWNVRSAVSLSLELCVSATYGLGKKKLHSILIRSGCMYRSASVSNIKYDLKKKPLCQWCQRLRTIFVIFVIDDTPSKSDDGRCHLFLPPNQCRRFMFFAV